ncbi:MAG: enoyl-CoA hydratase-related protein, partial [Myxococcales bacterium]
MSESNAAFPTYETLATALNDGVLTVTLNRPDRLNAFNTQMMNDLLAMYDAVDDDDRVGVVIVTGAGRGFCAGADLGSGGATFDSGGTKDNPEGPRPVPRDGGGRVTLRTFDLKKP